MKANFNVDPQLLDKAMKLSGIKTEQEVVCLALREFVQRLEQAEILKLFGTIEFDDDFDYKAQRKQP